MGSLEVVSTKPHAVLLPFPAQGHINPMLSLAKLLHAAGFHVTFVNTHYNHRRLLRSRGPDSFRGLPGFRFETVPDGLPLDDDDDRTQDIPALCLSTRANSRGPLRELLVRLNGAGEGPPVSCVVADGAMGFAVYVGEEVGVPVMLFFTPSACGFLGYLSYSELVRRGYTPLKDEGCLTNGYLDTPIDCIPGMNNVRLRDLPTFVRTTDADDTMLNFSITKCDVDAPRAAGVIINTFDDLERDVLAAIRSKLPNLYTVGPLSALCRGIPAAASSIGSNLWREDSGCLKWLDAQRDRSVLYVNFGSITTLSARQVAEFAWGLARSGKAFLWVVRPDLVAGGGDAAALPPEFVAEVRERAMFAGWCAQEAILAHQATGGFLTHCGWNSMLESLSEGVPMICWPFFAEQQTNCRYACMEWGVGMEVEGEVRRERVEEMVRELMDGEKGVEMKRRALEWKDKARKAIEPLGSSYVNMECLIKDLATGLESK